MDESNIDLEWAKSCTSAIFSKPTRKVADAIVETVNELEDYWPLTVRQVYYQLVAKLQIDNVKSQYSRVSRILVKIRENDILPWSCIADRSRRTTDKRGYANLQAYLGDIVEGLAPKYYARCYVQKQDVYVEVSVEKDALSAILEDELWIYCTRLNIVRGQCSATHIELMAQRFDEAIMQGLKPILLHFGDLDPSGVTIPKAIKRKLLERHYVDVEVRSVALTPKQVKEHNLPSTIESAKPNDPNYIKWLDIYGPDQPAVELDALHPKHLKQLLRDELGRTYNIGAMTKEIETEKKERALVKSIKRDFKGLLFNQYGIEL